MPAVARLTLNTPPDGVPVTMVARSGWSAFVGVRVRTHLTRSAPLLNQQSTGKSLTVRAVSAGASVMSTGRAASWPLVPPVLVSPA